VAVVFLGRAGRSAAFRASEHSEARDGADKAGSRGAAMARRRVRLRADVHEAG